MERTGPRGSTRLAIAGAGMTGAYLYRLLTNRGWQVRLYDLPQEAPCGLKPCAWGVSADFFELAASAGLRPEDYLLSRFEHLLLHGVKLSADLSTIDKPRLVRDLLAGAEVLSGPVPLEQYDRVIDATGVSRALLPPVADEFLLNCRQYLVETEEPLELAIRLGGIGYAWCFPLDAGRYHVGCGSLLEDPQRVLERLGWLAGDTQRPPRRIGCGCSGRIRLTGPHGVSSFLAGGPVEGIWGVGEAVGCVAPLAGDGIVPGMRSVQLLLQHWDDPAAYQKALECEFDWMLGERRVIDRLRLGKRMGLKDAAVLVSNARRMGIGVGPAQALRLLNNLGKREEG